MHYFVALAQVYCIYSCLFDAADRIVIDDLDLGFY